MILGRAIIICPHGCSPRLKAGVAMRARAVPRGAPRTVKELLRTNDAVLITAIEALLKGAGIECMVADRHMSVLEGSLGVLPRRVLVADDEADEARRILTEAGLGHAIASA